MSDRFDDSEEADDYFAEVDDGDPTGLEPRFVRLAVLDLQPTNLNELKVDDLFAKFIGLRNQLTTDRRGWKAREEKVKNQMATIGSVLLMRADSLGVTSLSAGTGTGYKQSKERMKVAPDGWDALTQWVRETGNFQVLQKRVSSDAVKEIREETGEVPPGVEVTPETTFVVRSPTVRKR